MHEQPPEQKQNLLRKFQQWTTSRSKQFNLTISVLSGLVVFGSLLLVVASFAKKMPEIINQQFVQTSAAQEFTTFGDGAWHVSNGAYRLTNAAVSTSTATTPGNANLSIAKKAITTGEWQLQTDVTLVAGDFSVIFDYLDENNYYFANFSDTPTDNTSGIFKMEKGVQTKLGGFAAIAANKLYRIEIQKKKDDIKVYREDLSAKKGREFLVRATGKSFSSQRVGFGSRGGSAVFDNLVVTGVGAVQSPSPTPSPEEVPEPPVTPSPAPAPTPTPAPAPSPTPQGGRAVNVSTVEQLAAALTDARPGDVITMADGVYLNSKGMASPVAVGGKTYAAAFTAADKSGTADKPIVLQGSRKAIIDGGGTGSRYGFYLVNAKNWVVKGLTVTNVTKGIVTDGSSNVTIDGVSVHGTGQEGIHLRANSSDNIVKNSTVYNTGLKNAAYGEGVYIGSANSNWGTYTGGQPDRSDRNQVLNNIIGKTGAENIDVKEGTTGGLIQGNTFDGANMSGSWADSWIDMKGNNYMVRDNIGTTSSSSAMLDGFQVHGALSGWGNNNTFTNNTANVGGNGYGFWLQNNVTGNVISCNNKVTNAAKGLANVACKP